MSAFSFRPVAIRFIKSLRGLVVPAILLLAWQYASGLSATNAYAFVPLQTLFTATIELVENGKLWINFSGSLTRTAAGLSIGVCLGLGVGILMAFSRIAFVLINPLYHSIRQVPLLGLIPLIGLWFGNGESAKIFIISLAAFFPMLLNTYEGLRNVDKQFREIGDLYRFNRWLLFRKILWPASLPSIFTGLLLAIPFAWITCIGSELLFNAGAGLGNLMMEAETSTRMDIIVVCAIVVTLLGMSMNYGVSRLAAYSLRWRAPS